jgi:hypothetical protein
MQLQPTVHSDKSEYTACSYDAADDTEEDLAVGVGGYDGGSRSMSAVRDVVGWGR